MKRRVPNGNYSGVCDKVLADGDKTGFKILLCAQFLGLPNPAINGGVSGLKGIIARVIAMIAKETTLTRFKLQASHRLYNNPREPRGREFIV